jgi:hypothetical protein
VRCRRFRTDPRESRRIFASRVRVTDFAHDFSAPCPAFVKLLLAVLGCGLVCSHRHHDGTVPDVGIAGGRVRRKSRRAAESIMFSSRRSTRRLRNDKFDLGNREQFRTQASCSLRVGARWANPAAGAAQIGKIRLLPRLRVPSATRVSISNAPTKYQSGETNIDGRIWKIGDACVRAPLSRPLTSCSPSHLRSAWQ